MFKKIKNKKTMIAIIVTLFVVVVGTTYALFFSNTSIANLFSVGNFNVVTTETFTSPASWQPGQEIPKSITATNNGDIQAAFRVKYTEAWVDSNNSPISNVPANAVTINFINTRDWSYNSTDGYYYYNWIIEPGDTTRSLISGITLNQSLTGNASCVEDGNTYNCSSSISGLEGATYILTFTKETVIYSKYQSFWNTNQEITEYVAPPLYTLPYGRTESNLQLGDEICVEGDTTECFNFIRYDGDNIVMLSKYNLKVGNIYAMDDSYHFTKTGEYTSSDTGYGVQSSKAKGMATGTRYGTVAFSATNYWYDGSSLKSKYGSFYYTSNIYDTDYTEASGTNYSVAYYVENYKDKLEQYGVTVQEARLLTYGEATTNVGCSDSTYDCPSGFIRNTSFWLGSAYTNLDVWVVRWSGSFIRTTYSDEELYGVRPVIVVGKSDVSGNYDNAPVSVTIPSGRTKDNLQLGDEICVEGDTTECFNFIRYDGDNVVMLAKYNLKVGNIYNSSGTKQREFTSADDGYGLQSIVARGYVSGQYRYGTVTFSGTYYWYINGLMSKYGSSYNTSNIYDTDYTAASGTRYSVAYYVENYKSTLENYGLTVQDARLLTYTEATTKVGCSGGNYNCPTGFIRNTTFWLGSAKNDTYVWCAHTSGSFSSLLYSNDNYSGVRPVIVISKDAI